VRGDFNGNGQLDLPDVNMLNSAIAMDGGDLSFDLNADGAVTQTDLNVWVKDLRRTWIGDANLNGEFNSGDFVDVFQVGKYEQNVDAGWHEGDWTGDRRFGSGDFVAAFQDGGFERGPRAAVASVPEPGSGLLLLAVGAWILSGRKHGMSEAGRKIRAEK
jgi:hypothetical protein